MTNHSTQSDISDEFEALIPQNIRDKYQHLSYAEMSEKPECADYADDLQRFETEWFSCVG